MSASSQALETVSGSQTSMVLREAGSMVGPGPTVVAPDTTYGAFVMSVSRRGVDVLMDCCRPPVVAGLPLQQKDPGTCGLRDARVWSDWLAAHSIMCCVPPTTRCLIPVTPAAMPGVDWRENRDLNVS